MIMAGLRSKQTLDFCLCLQPVAKLLATLESSAFSIVVGGYGDHFASLLSRMALLIDRAGRRFTSGVCMFVLLILESLAYRCQISPM